MRNCVLFFCLVSITSLGFSQKQRSVTLGYAACSYKGDFSNYSTFNNSLIIGIRLNENKFLTGEFEARLGSVTAQSIEFSPPVVNYVKTNFFSVNYGLSFKLFEVKDKISIYLTPGLGVFRYNPKDEQGNSLSQNVSSRKKEEAYGSLAFMFPIKLSFRYQSSYGITYSLNSGYLNTRTDYIDNVSQLASDKNKDNIFYLGANVSFDIKSKIR